MLAGKGRRPLGIAPGDHNLEAISDQQPRQPAAEHAIAADDDHLHDIRRLRRRGSGTAHMSVRPKSA
jgi:hypothetical protein